MMTESARIRLSDHFTYGKLLRFTLPSIAMMVFSSIYGVVDGYFVSNYAGKTPFAAVNLVMPVLAIMGTVSFMFGTGGTALVAKTLGEGDKDRANRYFSLIVYVAFAVGVILAILGFVLIRPIAARLGAEGPLLDSCVRYARIVLLALPLFSMQVMFQSFFVAAEKPKLSFTVSVISGVANMALDAVLCILLPQELKLTGAAIATAVSQAVGGVIPLVYFSRENDSLLRLGTTKFEGRVLGRTCVNGVSEFLGNISASIVGVLFNLQLMKYAGEDGVSAYGVMMYASMIFTAAFGGYTMGIAPAISYHYGANDHSELNSLLRKSLCLCCIAGVSMVILGELLCVPMADIFVSYDSGLRSLTISGFRIFAISFIFIGFGIFSSGFFTALNDGVTSAIISFVRTMIFECAAVMLLPLIWEINGVWISVIVSEFLAVVLGIVFLITKQKKYQY